MTLQFTIFSESIKSQQTCSIAKPKLWQDVFAYLKTCYCRTLRLTLINLQMPTTTVKARRQIFQRFILRPRYITPLFSYATSKDVTSEGAYSIRKLYQDYPIVSKQPSTKPDELRAHVNYANEKTIKPLSYYGSAFAEASTLRYLTRLTIPFSRNFFGLDNSRVNFFRS